jgi:hypothetical protein
MSSENKLIYSGEACRMICNSKEYNPYAGTMAEAVWKLAHDSCVSCVEACNAIDAMEVVHSSWILNNDGSGTCKNCHRTTKDCWDYDRWMNYCPNCGAKMNT